MSGRLAGWRSARLWQPLGYAATAAWVLYVIASTGGDPSAPLFDYIFVVPIGMWALGISVAWAIGRLLPPSRPPRS